MWGRVSGSSLTSGPFHMLRSNDHRPAPSHASLCKRLTPLIAPRPAQS
jgi:hypothetical protein